MIYVVGDCYTEEISRHSKNSNIEFRFYPGYGPFREKFIEIMQQYAYLNGDFRYKAVLFFGYADILKLEDPNSIRKSVDKYVTLSNKYLGEDVYFIDPFPHNAGSKTYINNLFCDLLTEAVGDKKIISQSDILNAMDKKDGLTDDDYLQDSTNTGTMLKLELSQKLCEFIEKKLLTLMKTKCYT